MSLPAIELASSVLVFQPGQHAFLNKFVEVGKWMVVGWEAERLKRELDRVIGRLLGRGDGRGVREDCIG
jgi:allantoicase